MFEVTTPAALVDIERLDRNLARFATDARTFGVALRPHVKTHKCVAIAERQRALGARGFTVATLEEAHMLVDAGMDDVLFAFPVPPVRAREVASLAERSAFAVTVDSIEAIEALAAARARVRVMLEIDVGHGRSGVPATSPEVTALAERVHLTPGLAFGGLLSHAGHAYRATDRGERAKIAEDERATMVALAASLRASGLPVDSVSVGSTPTVTAQARFDGLTEIRPGNYCFFDASQVELGSASLADVAFSVASSVVSSRPAEGRSILDAGALALSTDRTRSGVHGLVVDDDGEVVARVVRVSQEHGFADASLPVGRVVRVVPAHSCLSAACFDSYLFVERGRVIGRHEKGAARASRECEPSR